MKVRIFGRGQMKVNFGAENKNCLPHLGQAAVAMAGLRALGTL
jgi:hypothetical protein